MTKKRHLLLLLFVFPSMLIASDNWESGKGANTFKGRKNGLRADLAQMLADLQPRFVRFPGGCLAHADGIENIYRWENTIGPLEARKPLRNLWGYHQTTRFRVF